MDHPETYKVLKSKKKEGISVLYNRYGKNLYSYAIINWKVDEDQAWDIVYRTIYKIAETIRQYEFENEKKFRSFVFKIFINNLRNHYREIKRKKESLDFTPLTDMHLHTNGELAGHEQEQQEESPSMQLLKAELEKLEDWERILLLLRSQNLAYSEIAKHVDKPADQLKVYYQRLKKKIMKRLDDKIKVTTGS